MIREYKEQDIDEILKIWFEASLISHSFISKSFWESKLEDMRNIYIPNSETFVYEEDEKVIGFFSLYENTLAAIFVSTNKQGKGIGKILLKKAKELRNNLILTVYVENTNSIEFYKKQNFIKVKEQIDKHTDKKELLMKWTK